MTDTKNLLKAILKEEKLEELKKNNIIIKNGAFTLSEKQKASLEKSLNGSFKKRYFTEKNAFLFSSVKEEMIKLGYSFKTEEELKEELEKLEEEELEEELEEDKK